MGYEGENPAALRSIANRNLTKSMQTLLGICTGIVSDNHINDNEFKFLHTWLIENEQLSDKYPASAIHLKIKYILQDEVITEEELNHLLITLKDITGAHFMETGAAKPEIIGLPLDGTPVVFRNSVFCFTGEFSFGERSYCQRITEQKGARIANAMSSKVNYLVIGENGSDAWKYQSFGTKIEDAILLKSTNHPISIITERHWIDSLQSLPRDSLP